MRRIAFALLVAAGACVPEQGPTMLPGENCLGCHGGVPAAAGGGGGEGEGDDGRPWTFAGTVYRAANAPASGGVKGAVVEVTDANGRSLSVHTNLVGNFYSAESMSPPLKPCVAYQGVTRCMPVTAPHGACNFCHAQPPRGGAPGRIVAGGPQAPL